MISTKLARMGALVSRCSHPATCVSIWMQVAFLLLNDGMLIWICYRPPSPVS